jgi:uncharacterized protein DUF6328
MNTTQRTEENEALGLADAATYLLDEARTVLPGIQALFGFQLVAVFNSAFADQLSIHEQRLHLGATALVALSVALVMSPAAYHRQSGPREVSETFVRISRRLLLLSMGPLAVGICLDFYLISRVVLNNVVASLLAAVLFVIYIGLWFVLPRIRTLRRRSEPGS